MKFQKGLGIVPTTSTQAPAQNIPAPALANAYQVLTETIIDPVATTSLKVRGAFKFRVQNESTVGITILGSMYIAPFGDETIESGSPETPFAEDVTIKYDELNAWDEVKIKLTKYSKK